MATKKWSFYSGDHLIKLIRFSKIKFIPHKSYFAINNNTGKIIGFNFTKNNLFNTNYNSENIVLINNSNLIDFINLEPVKCSRIMLPLNLIYLNFHNNNYLLISDSSKPYNKKDEFSNKKLLLDSDNTESKNLSIINNYNYIFNNNNKISSDLFVNNRTISKVDFSKYMCGNAIIHKLMTNKLIFNFNAVNFLYSLNDDDYNNYLNNFDW